MQEWKCRSDKVWKAIRRKYSKVPDNIWLSWLSCLLVAKRNSQASNHRQCVIFQQLPAVWPSDAPRNALRDKRLQFLRAVSDAVGSEKMLSEGHSDADDDDDTEAPNDNTQHQNDDDTSSDDAGTPTTVSADAAVDFCEVCLVAPRDIRIALVPCGHQRFCESCANEVHNQGRGCPFCRTPINMLLHLY